MKKKKKGEPAPKARANGKIKKGQRNYNFRLGNDYATKGTGTRPKTLGSAYRRLLLTTCPLDPDERTWAEVIGEAILTKALAGDVQAAQEIRKATEGELSRHAIDWEELAREYGLNPRDIFDKLEMQLRNMIKI